MIDLFAGEGKNAGVVGMGRSGAAAARLLATLGFRVTGFDSSPDAHAVENVNETVFGAFTDSDVEGLSLLVLSPGVPVSSGICARCEEMGIPVIGEAELALRNTAADVLAVTGSNGKTTTVEWLGHVIRTACPNQSIVVAGNMGYALSDAVLDHPECRLLVVELSSYQLETAARIRANSAVILNLTPDHLARHGNMENYGAAKARIFLNQKQGDTAILNADDTLLEQYANTSAGRQMFFSLQGEVDSGAWMDSEGMLFYRDASGTGKVLHSAKLSLPGRHNTANALAVICMAASWGIPIKKLAEGLQDFRGVSHRIEPLGEAAGLVWFNDSKSTNIDSLKVALESFEERVILLAGGQEKSSDYSVLRDLISKKVKGLVLFGSGAAVLGEQWAGTVETVFADSLQDAVKRAEDLASEGDTVLLSPGCASFDQYKNFEERGDHFRRIVQALK